MRRVICIILVVLFCAGTGLAEVEVNLKNMTTDELIRLKTEIESELVAREEEGDIDRWYDYGVGLYLPNPESVFGRMIQMHPTLKANDESFFRGEILEVEREEFEAYIEACQKLGFTLDVRSSYMSFFATNSDGVELRLGFLTDRISVSASKGK